MIHSPIVSSGGEVAIQNIWRLCLGGDVDFVCTVTVGGVAHGTVLGVPGTSVAA